MRRIVHVAIMITLSVCSGCYAPIHSFSHRMLDEKILESIIDGETSKEDILLMLGAPDKVMENERLFQYWWRESRGYLYIFPFSGGSIPGHIYSLHIYFDENNIIKKHEIKRKGELTFARADKFLLELYAGKYAEAGAANISEIELNDNGRGTWRRPEGETSFKWSIADNELILDTKSGVIIGHISDDVLELPLQPGPGSRHFKKIK